jgi:hypothetical protein
MAKQQHADELRVAVQEYLKALDEYQALDCPGGRRYDKLKAAEDRLRGLSRGQPGAQPQTNEG